MKNMRTLMLLLLVVTAASRAAAQSAPPIDRAVVLEASLATSQREFRIGEIIPLRLAFSSKIRNRYQVNAAQYDRSGRMNYEHFAVSPRGRGGRSVTDLHQQHGWNNQLHISQTLALDDQPEH
jgi:hypothetical protein